MKWKTVVAIFVVVVVYLVTGGLVFRALEQPFEQPKEHYRLGEAEFLRDHICVSPQNGSLIQVSREGCAIASPLEEGGLDVCLSGSLSLAFSRDASGGGGPLGGDV